MNSPWIKGGIVGGIISLAVFGIIYSMPGSFLDNVYLILYFPVYISLALVFGVGQSINVFFHFLFVAIEGIVIGSLVGLIIGKYKKSS